MRRLLYVPILHEEADFGSLGPALARASATLSGSQRWARHLETVRGFWESVAAYLDLFDAGQLRVYQDGLAAEGALGRRIVEEGASRCSQNYGLVLGLLRRGAQLRKTEDPALLLQERAYLTGAAPGVPSNEVRQELMERRDISIAQAINATLQEGEAGVLLIGAGHNVLPHLSRDICVELVKDPKKVVQYMREVLLGESSAELEDLASYVAAPVNAWPRGETRGSGQSV